LDELLVISTSDPTHSVGNIGICSVYASAVFGAVLVTTP
jgi:hypothetical protein